MKEVLLNLNSYNYTILMRSNHSGRRRRRFVVAFEEKLPESGVENLTGEVVLDKIRSLPRKTVGNITLKAIS